MNPAGRPDYYIYIELLNNKVVGIDWYDSINVEGGKIKTKKHIVKYLKQAIKMLTKAKGGSCELQEM